MAKKRIGILTGGGEKRFRIDTRELLQMFDEYNAYKEDQFEQINYEEKKARDHASKVQEDQDYFDFVAKWGERLRRDWQASRLCWSIRERPANDATHVGTPNAATAKARLSSVVSCVGILLMLIAMLR